MPVAPTAPAGSPYTTPPHADRSTDPSVTLARAAAVTVRPPGVRTGRTTTSRPLKAPGKNCSRAASTPLRYSRNGSEGSNGANGSAGVSSSVVAHEIVCRPTRASHRPTGSATSRRSKRWRHRTSPRCEQRPVEAEPVARRGGGAGRQRRERRSRPLLVEEQLLVRGLEPERTERRCRHQAQALEVGRAARAEGARAAHAAHVEGVAAEPAGLRGARGRRGAGHQGREQRRARQAAPPATRRHRVTATASRPSRAHSAGRRSRPRRPPAGSAGARAPSPAGRGWRR